MMSTIVLGFLYLCGAVTHYSLIMRTELYLSAMHSTKETPVRVRMTKSSKMWASAIWPLMSILLLVTEMGNPDVEIKD